MSLGGGQSGGGSTTSTQTVNMGPWQNQVPFLNDVLDNASKNYHAGNLQYYPGSTVSPFTPAQTQGYGNVINTAGAGTSAVAPTNAMLTATANGQYLNPSTNPWLQSTFNNAANAVTDAYQTATAPHTDSQFEMANRYGSGSALQARNQNQLALGRTLDTLGSSIFGGNYQNERFNQLRASALAPTLDQAQYIDPTAMVNAGGAQQGQAQKELSDQVARFNYNQMSPWQTLGLYKSMVDGNYGQQGTTTTQTQQPYYSNPLGSIFGGALGLGGLAGQLGWQPFGAGAGAGAGAAGGIGAILPGMPGYTDAVMAMALA